jgi:hypothetical protein
MITLYNYYGNDMLEMKLTIISITSRTGWRKERWYVWSLWVIVIGRCKIGRRDRQQNYAWKYSLQYAKCWTLNTKSIIHDKLKVSSSRSNTAAHGEMKLKTSKYKCTHRNRGYESTIRYDVIDRKHTPQYAICWTLNSNIVSIRE